MEMKKIGVLGAGMMGAEIALCFAMNGYETILGDINQELADKGKAKQASVLDRRIAKGKLEAEKKDEILARVTDGWRPGVGHEGARLPAEQAGKDRLSRRRAVVLVVAHERLFNLKMVQQLHGHARILGGDEIRAAQRLDGAGREIPEVSDGRSHQIYNSGHPDHSLSLK